MTRLQTNDFAMKAVIEAHQSTGYLREAENIKKNYEVQRVEIIANGGDNDNN